eukprot:TRINITY_DN14658_c0_g1_i1.p1 TRINITY_DN14658_c0_g1~~TRINITY_DN14658_c0_g1_i1.p1  ORF type:complete len:943 (+),score=270.59 TRINITY_DN14658_c0_g1_i1:67-2895(+)
MPISLRPCLVWGALSSCLLLLLVPPCSGESTVRHRKARGLALVQVNARSADGRVRVRTAAEAARWTVEETSLDEAGYQSVVSQKSNELMGKFIRRSLGEYGGRILNEAAIEGIVPFYSGVVSTQSFAALVRELSDFPFVDWSGVKHDFEATLRRAREDTAMQRKEQLRTLASAGQAPGAICDLNDAGYSEVSALRDSKQMEIFARRVIAVHGGKLENDGDLRGMVPFYSGEAATQSFPVLVEELGRVPWVSGFRKDGDQEALGATAGLSAEGYNVVARMTSEHALELYFRRVIAAYGANIEDEGALKRAVPYYRNSKSSTYNDFLTELSLGTWVSGFPRSSPAPPNTQTLPAIVPAPEILQMSPTQTPQSSPAPQTTQTSPAVTPAPQILQASPPQTPQSSPAAQTIQTSPAVMPQPPPAATAEAAPTAPQPLPTAPAVAARVSPAATAQVPPVPQTLEPAPAAAAQVQPAPQTLQQATVVAPQVPPAEAPQAAPALQTALASPEQTPLPELQASPFAVASPGKAVVNVTETPERVQRWQVGDPERFSDAGFQKVLAQQNNGLMGKYVRDLLVANHATILDETAFKAFVPKYSGKRDVDVTFEDLLSDLEHSAFVEGAPPPEVGRMVDTVALEAAEAFGPADVDPTEAPPTVEALRRAAAASAATAAAIMTPASAESAPAALGATEPSALPAAQTPASAEPSAAEPASTQPVPESTPAALASSEPSAPEASSAPANASAPPATAAASGAVETPPAAESTSEALLAAPVAESSATEAGATTPEAASSQVSMPTVTAEQVAQVLSQAEPGAAAPAPPAGEAAASEANATPADVPASPAAEIEVATATKAAEPQASAGADASAAAEEAQAATLLSQAEAEVADEDSKEGDASLPEPLEAAAEATATALAASREQSESSPEKADDGWAELWRRVGEVQAESEAMGL